MRQDLLDAPEEKHRRRIDGRMFIFGGGFRQASA